MIDYEKMPPRQGWVCPKCGRVYSPNMMMCIYCGENEKEFELTKNFNGEKQQKWNDER